MNQEDFLSQEEATRLWRRAAKIQAEAARQAEMDAAREVTRELDAEQAARSAEGYALTHVRAAAVEAGIGAEFVDAALSDIRAERALGGSGGARLARRLLGNPDEALAVSRVINAPVEEVLEAMESVMPGEPFGLTLRDRRGDPASGGLLIFDIPGASLLGAQQPGFLGQASYADLREIYASLRTLGDASCELTLRSPVAWAFALNALIATVATGTEAGSGSESGRPSPVSSESARGLPSSPPQCWCPPSAPAPAPPTSFSASCTNTPWAGAGRPWRACWAPSPWRPKAVGASRRKRCLRARASRTTLNAASPPA